MSVEPVGFISAAARLDDLVAAAASKPDADFSVWLETQLQELNEQIAGAESGLRDLATGETSNIHQVLLSLEEAKLSFSLMVQVRNKVLEAYQDIMRMQI